MEFALLYDVSLYVFGCMCVRLSVCKRVYDHVCVCVNLVL